MYLRKMSLVFVIPTIVLLSVLLINSLLFDAISASGSHQSNNSGKALNRIVNAKGWQIPGLLNDAPIVNVIKNKVNDIAVERRQHRIDNKLIVKVEFFRVVDDQLLISSADYLVGNVFSYCVEGHKEIFAYEVYLMPVTIEDDGRKTIAPAIVPIRFYDENSDGKFEVRVSGLSDIMIPPWAKNKKAHN